MNGVSVPRQPCWTPIDRYARNVLGLYPIGNFSGAVRPRPTPPYQDENELFGQYFGGGKFTERHNAGSQLVRPGCPDTSPREAAIVSSPDANHSTLRYFLGWGAGGTNRVDISVQTTACGASPNPSGPWTLFASQFSGVSLQIGEPPHGFTQHFRFHSYSVVDDCATREFENVISIPYFCP